MGGRPSGSSKLEPQSVLVKTEPKSGGRGKRNSGNVEHETASEPFKPSYTMTEERSRDYVSRMHNKTASKVGE